jgi:phage N-6-adenine-methyltransferase
LVKEEQSTREEATAGVPESDALADYQPHLFWQLSTSTEWETPQDLFDKLDAEFQFELDPCCTPDNAKCGKYFTAEQNGLTQPWGGAVFCNPPYGRELGLWVAKAYQEARAGATVVCLLPANTDTGWFPDYCLKGEIRWIRGRLGFGGTKGRSPFASMLVIFRPEAKP